MTYYQASEENMKKVEGYFVARAVDSGSNRFEATIVEIAEGSGVALATAHKAIKQLEEDRVIKVIRPSSRRFPISYVYNKDIEGFEHAKDQNSQIEYLQELVEKLKNDIQMLDKENKEQAGVINILRSQLEQKGR